MAATAKKTSKKKTGKTKGSSTLKTTPLLAREATKPAEAPADLSSAIADYAASFNSEGVKYVATADEAPNTYILRRPCGITQLDIDTGGGLPAGGMSVLSGPDNAGKTFLLYKYMAMHQRIYRADASIAFATVEGAFDFRRAINAGMRVPIPDEMLAQQDQWLLSRGLPVMTAEERAYHKQCVGSFVILRADTGEQLLEMVLEGCKRRLFHIIGVDSLSMLLPEVDAAKDVGERQKLGSRATLQTDFQLKYTPTTSGLHGVNPTTLIALNQVRANTERANAPGPQQKYIKEWRPTGAYSIRHGKLVDVQIWGGAKLKRTVNGSEVVAGKELKWEITKGKAGTHDNIQGAVSFWYEEHLPAGTDDLDTLIAAGWQLGCIANSTGAKVVVINSTSKKQTSLSGPNMATFKRMMAADPDFELAVRAEVMNAAGIQCLYRL